MPLIREFAVLTARTCTLWWRFLPQVGTWLILGWVLYTSCLLVSATIGNTYGVLGAIIFVASGWIRYAGTAHGLGRGGAYTLILIGQVRPLSILRGRSDC